MNEPHVHHSERSLRIDVLRGIAVIGMVIAHALFFFHDKTNPFLTPLESLLNTTVFTLFVFVFGMSLSKWLDTHAHDHTKSITAYALKRALAIYMVYVLTATVAQLTSKPGQFSLINVITLQTPPNFTEYMPLFIIFVLLIPLIRPLLRASRDSIFVTFLVGAVSYYVGVTLYDLTVPDVFLPMKSLFAGDETLLRFPVLFYFPVLLWGLWWQYDSDHRTQNASHTFRHTMLFIGSIMATVVGILATRVLNIPILNPDIRWPPSVTFLTTGMSLAGALLLIAPSLRTTGTAIKRVLSYFGRDALEIWTNHLLLLFLYRQFVSVTSGNMFVVGAFILILIILTVFVSSLTIINNIRFPFTITTVGRTRLRKRHIVIAGVALLLFMWSTYMSGGSPYGSTLRVPALTIEPKIPPTATAELSASHTWYVKRNPVPQSVELTLTVKDKEQMLQVAPDLVQIKANNESVDFVGVAAMDGTIHFTKPVADMNPGVYAFSAVIDNGGNTITTPSITVFVSEPLLVSWTFDWEGWDAPNEVMTSINGLAVKYPTVRFTHFISPRTFLPGVLTPIRANEITAFLNERSTKGDEIAMHAHMHFDLVRAAGIATRSAHPWGLMTQDGYDAPTTEYSPSEFRQIIEFGLAIASQSGLPKMKGYRAGGWFLNTAQLNELNALGFTYDSSGRDRPATGAFRTTPWNLPIGAQPYYPSKTDQNVPSTDTTGILEIPSNGLSTYDQTPEMIIGRISSVYQGGILDRPKALVFVSHPQFYTKEFMKIPDVLTRIMTMAQVTELGPAVFVTTGEIAEIWEALRN